MAARKKTPKADKVMAAEIDQFASILHAAIYDSPSEQLVLAGRFWARVSLTLAESAAVTATRLRHRAADHQLLAFYAYDDPRGHTVEQIQADWRSAADRYDHVRGYLLARVAEGLDWMREEHARLTERGL